MELIRQQAELVVYNKAVNAQQVAANVCYENATFRRVGQNVLPSVSCNVLTPGFVSFHDVTEAAADRLRYKQQCELFELQVRTERKAAAAEKKALAAAAAATAAATAATAAATAAATTTTDYDTPTPSRGGSDTSKSDEVIVHKPSSDSLNYQEDVGAGEESQESPASPTPTRHTSVATPGDSYYDDYQEVYERDTGTSGAINGDNNYADQYDNYYEDGDATSTPATPTASAEVSSQGAGKHAAGGVDERPHQASIPAVMIQAPEPNKKPSPHPSPAAAKPFTFDLYSLFKRAKKK